MTNKLIFSFNAKNLNQPINWNTGSEMVSNDENVVLILFWNVCYKLKTVHVIVVDIGFSFSVFVGV